MITIYKATNKISGKSYVGIDSNWPHRKHAHRHAVKRGSNLVFHNAIRTYGWENFDWEVVEQSEDYTEMSTLREEFYIRKFNTHYIDGDGYNMTFGGEGTLGWSPSAETRQRISEANIGKDAWNKGKPSPWCSERNRNSRGTKRPKQEKEYLITDPTGKVYHIKGLMKFCKEHNLHTGNMSSVARGKLGHYKKWLCTTFQSNET
tara:strand:+ start:9626 stop:10237 length:612 start_codon:yes stop_codon:yes gene_type:complete